LEHKAFDDAEVEAIGGEEAREVVFHPIEDKDEEVAGNEHFVQIDDAFNISQ